MGRSKAWLPFGNEIMLPRVVRLLAEAVEPVVVVAAPDQDVPPLPPEIPIVRDAQPKRGPLQGLSAGLSGLQAKTDAFYLSSCDVPFLNPHFALRLVELLEDDHICVPKVGGHHHPLAAVYRTSVKAPVERLLAEDRLRPFFLFQEVPTRVVEAQELADVDPNFETLRNLNTPEEYKAALEDFQTRSEI